MELVINTHPHTQSPFVFLITLTRHNQNCMQQLVALTSDTHMHAHTRIDSRT